MEMLENSGYQPTEAGGKDWHPRRWTQPLTQPRKTIPFHLPKTATDPAM
ncbi:MAG: hypothetical protein KatS3mg109_0714 [Pirellulaceae bacterium]|nr:MAG: hypothetical protein KatS3mg109_0714 [Pirellulaceae bacterium]